MKFVIYTIFTIASVILSNAQEVKIAALPRSFQNIPTMLPNSQVLDTTVLTVHYQISYPIDNSQGGFQQIKDILCFQIGKNVCKTFSENLYLLERNKTFHEKNNVKFRLNYIPYTIFTNYPKGCITEENRIPYSVILQGTLQVVAYTESIPAMDWQISEKTDSIAGFHCFNAKCTFRGREWEVWYTPDIPTTFNVWKFSGLPGLILKANDSTGDYAFEALEIENTRIPIELFDWQPSRKARAEWRKLEENMYKKPSDYFTQNGEISVFDAKNKQAVQAGEWSILYNPIEKE